VRVLTVCPKCQRERQPGDTSCRRCGLLVEKWEGFIVELPSLPPVDEAWKKLEQTWEDDDAHRRFLDQAAAFDGLDVAAALYRDARRRRPADARAEAGIKRAILLAENLYAAKSQAARTQVPPGWFRVVGLVGAIVVVLAGMGALYLIWRH
jgi:hypothetical protein